MMEQFERWRREQEELDSYHEAESAYKAGWLAACEMIESEDIVMCGGTCGYKPMFGKNSHSDDCPRAILANIEQLAK